MCMCVCLCACVCTHSHVIPVGVFKFNQSVLTSRVRKIWDGQTSWYGFIHCFQCLMPLSVNYLQYSTVMGVFIVLV